MANTIILKRSATPGKVPTTGQLALGEIAINTYDGLLYIKKDDGTPSVVQIGGVTSVNGETGAVTLDTGDVAENGNLYFTNARARSALSAGTGISYNSTTGAISTAQNLSTAGSPTFAGLTLTGNMGITGSIVPSADITYDLGSPTYQWKDIYVGPGSLYVNGSKVLQDDTGTITFSADTDQNIRIKTTGNGILQLGSSTTILQVDSTLQITSGKNITDSAGVEVNFGDNIDMNNNKIVGLGAPSANTDAATKGYVDTAVGAISTSTISQGNSSVQVVDSGTGTVTVTVDGSTALTVNSTGVVVAGNFTVQGTTTSVESNTVSVADNIITLNSDVTGAPTQNAGIEVERGDETNVQIRWNEGTDKWTFTNDGATYQAIPALTTDLAEGTNLYYTDTRARTALSASSATGISYNSSTGAFSLGSIPNSSLANSSITINGTAVSLGGTRTLDTDAVGEGTTNQYFTQARARSSLSAGTGISYNSSTGAISTSAIPNASLANSSVTVGTTAISLGASSTTLAGLTSVTSTSFTGALTGNADTATSAGKWTTARTITLGGDLTGSVSIDGSANVTLNATVAGNTVALGTDTTGNYVTSITNGSYITGADGGSEGAALTLAVDATSANTASKVVARDASGNFAAGTITANLSGNVTGNVTGNADTATSAGKWTTARTITLGGDLTGNVSIDGSANVTLTATVAANSVALGTDTTGDYVASLVAGTGITLSNNSGEGATPTVAVDTSTIATQSWVTTQIQTKDNTDEITEGTTNLYFTNARARGAVSFTAGSGAYNSTTGVFTIPTNTNQLTNGASFITLASLSAGTGISYNNTTGVISTSAIPNSSLSNSSITINGTSVSLGGTRTLVTDDIAEDASPVNLWYTDARSRAALSFTAGSGAYNSSTGVITIPTNTNQLTNGAGYVTSSGVTSITAGSYLTGGTITSTGTIAVDATSANTASKVVARDASGNFSAGTITATLSGTATGLAGTPNITVGTITSGAISATGAITATGEITAYFSDLRLKTNIVPVTDALDKVEALNGVTFDPNETALGLGVTAGKQMGVIAQEVEAVAPELVTNSAFEGYKTVKYDKLTALLIEAVKELSAKVKTLEAQLGNAKPQL